MMNNILDIEAAKPAVIGAIQRASAKTGVDFAYLVNQARVESNFDTDAQAKTSSARGLFQFIDSTWTSMIDKHGSKYGYDNLTKEQSLALRDDPKASALMAAELASENEAVLKNRLGQNTDIGATELYMAHFLGAGEAARFLELKEKVPNAEAAAYFPKAAKANPGIFGKQASIDNIYERFSAKFENNIETPREIQQVAVQPEKTIHPWFYKSNREAAQALETHKARFSAPVLDLLSNKASHTEFKAQSLALSSRIPANYLYLFNEQRR